MDQSPSFPLESAPLWADDRFRDEHVLCIEFVNTVSWRGRPNPDDQMASPAAWLAWIEANGVLPSEARAELGRRASMWPFEAESGFRRAIEFREALDRLLRDAIEGKRAPDKSELDDVLARAFERTRLRQEGGVWSWTFEPLPVDWETPLYPVALSAAQLLTSSWREHLRACERDECQWLFLDLTKNHSRKWCDMASCGNVMKARRSYARRKSAPTGPQGRSASRPR